MNSQEIDGSIHKAGNWRAARYLVTALALGGWLSATAFAQGPNKGASSRPVAASADSSSSSADQLNSGDQSAPSGINAGNYNVQGSFDFGARYSNISGSTANYDTFVNLQQGPRLLDFSVNAYSLNHKGAYFDTLSLTGFGFGGDPVDVVRLSLAKDKWYNLAGTYRRYKYLWEYNLLANPLNPANSNPEQPITVAPHLMDLSHRMTDLQLTLFPQSAVHVRLGYTHSLEHGPSFTTDGAAASPVNEIGDTALLLQNFKTAEDNYDAGIDFEFLPRTTLSYDEYVQHFKQDTYAQDGNLIFQLPDGTPVDLGIVFSAGANCLNSSGYALATCQGDVAYRRGTRPRSTIPIEHFRFQTTYFRNLNMTGQISYSSGSEKIANNGFFNNWFGLNTRIASLGTSDLATTNAKRVTVNGDWNAVYDVTAKFRIMDSFDYNTFRIPGIDALNVTNFYAPAGALTLTEAAAAAASPSQFLFNPTNCPAPFTAPTCPQHSAGSSADSALGYDSTYLAQDFRENTFELAYDFTPKVGAHIGYRYTKRKIYDSGALFYTAETYDPGGRTGAALAFRGDCASSGVLPAGSSFAGVSGGTCVVQSDGSVVFTGLEAGSDTSHNLAADIDGNSALFGLWVRPAGNFRTSFDLELFSAGQSFTRITPRLLRHYDLNTTYTPVRWADITGAIDIIDSSDAVTEVQNKDHNRSYGLSTTFMPGSRFSFDLSYNYSDVFTQAFECFADSGAASGLPAGFSPTVGATTVPTCPLVDPDGNPSPVTIGALSAYQSKSNFAGADLMVKPIKPLTFTLGYAGTFVRGTTSYTNPATLLTANFTDRLTPWGPLRFNYQMPYVTMNWSLYRGLSYIASWNYYGYNSRGNNSPTGLAPLGTQDFNGNNMTMSARYAF